LLPACSKSLWGTVSLIPVEKNRLQKTSARVRHYQIDVEVLVGGGELLLVVAEVGVVEHLEGAALANGDALGLILVEYVLQAGRKYFWIENYFRKVIDFI
jgi:hypothetical protein